MRVTSYNVLLDGDRKPMLVKERSVNCTEIKNLNQPEYIMAVMSDVFNADRLAEEHMWLIGLDSKSHPLGIFELSHGTVCNSLVSPREIFVRMCLVGAAGFVMVHNHPSGDCGPSDADVQVTEQIKKASELMGIGLLDHIIIGRNDFYSFFSHGLMQK